MKKVQDLAVKVGVTKQNKAIWKTVGAVMEGDNGRFLFLDKTFNPAGVPSEGSSIIISMFDPKPSSQTASQVLGFDDSDPFGN